MLMAVVFGWEAPEFVIPLPRLGDYLFALEAPQNWPAGVEIELRFYRTAEPDADTSPFVWPAVITGALARWHATAAQIDAVRAAQARFVWAVYTNEDGIVLEWMRGAYRAS
jgi:hypothetical protein